MEPAEAVDIAGSPALVGRLSLCLPNDATRCVMHHGDDSFDKDVRRHFAVAESNASERIVKLKALLRASSTHDFWSILMEGMTEIADAQYGFVAKRILFDDQDSAVEMPPIGEPGSCLMGLAFFFNDGHGTRGMFRDYKYLAYGAPCAHMRHDKVFLIPERLNYFVPENVNNFPFPSDAYLGVPLFADGKCFAHFGMMWTEEALARRALSWNFIELFLHSLEDQILQRIFEGEGFAKPDPRPAAALRPRVIPQEAVPATQSLRPYARSLSHELRTPMQGVVGMLDVMHTTVEEAVESGADAQALDVFQTLRENIQVVQGPHLSPFAAAAALSLTCSADSSRRAIEAADNVVHAYDLNMEVPDTPLPPTDEPEHGPPPAERAGPPVDGPPSGLAGAKRRRSPSVEWNLGPAAKHRAVEPVDLPGPTRPGPVRIEGLFDASEATSVSPKTRPDDGHPALAPELPSTPALAAESTSIPDFESVVTPGLEHTKLRELLRYVINESLRVGGRPDSAIAVDTTGGERIEIRSRNSRGDAKTTVIDWSVDAAVPETLLVKERDLAKLISCVFLNALKFTDRGRITLKASVSPRSRFVVITVEDTGPGIPPDFLPSLFKPFSREDESLTRQKDGLGLGLLVAKGLVRNIGGDLACVRSDTSGPLRGSEFEIRVPLTPLDAGSAPSTPTGRASGRSASTRSASIPRLVLDPEDQGPGRLQLSPAPSPDAVGSASQLAPGSRSRRSSVSGPSAKPERGLDLDRELAKKHPLTFLVAEDNKINRNLLVTMLGKLGYKHVYEAYDGADAVRQMEVPRSPAIDVVLMDLWMPNVDGYQATEQILAMPKHTNADGSKNVAVLAVTADVTREAWERAVEVGMERLMTKPYRLLHLERLIREHCGQKMKQRSRTT
ncbi:MAG: hypothetical protein M1832_003265 [Thelocarpon impressellum]|nr:MAG: hypothetical protein M1832_003265 [Thelocarpon impressellum]